MEFTHRGVQSQPAQTTNHNSEAAASSAGRGRRHSDFSGLGKWLRILSVVLLFSVTILVLAMTSLLYYGNGNEYSYVNTSQYQAVDLNIGTATAMTRFISARLRK
jgi:hypothetical protein